MFQVDETTVPWADRERINRNLIGLDAQQQHAYKSKDINDFYRHERFSKRAMSLRRPFSWMDENSVIHITEIMPNPYFGLDRVTLCRAFRLNKIPQYKPGAQMHLDIIPCEIGVNCIFCLAEK